MPQSFACMQTHVVFSTKQQQMFIDNALQARLYEYIGGTLRKNGNILLAAGGMPDHVHLLISLGKESAISETVRLVKANSSKWGHATFSNQEQFAWQSGYGAFAVSFSHLANARKYIANQHEHHQRLTLQDELKTLLQRHHVEYDEQFLWD